MIQEDIPNNAAVMGKYLMEKLRNLQKQYPIIGDVRGRGHIMVATEFTNSDDGTPNGEVVKKVRSAKLWYMRSYCTMDPTIDWYQVSN
jgi:4-aminobutyrate aminotransferase-like enzyme